MGLFAGQEPQTSLPRRIGPERRLAIVRVPLADVIRTAHALGVTVNDLLLTAVTSGVRDLLAARGELIPGLVLRTSVPAATGGPGQVAAMLVAELPVGEPDPLRRLALVARSTASGKSQLRTGVGDGRGVLTLPVILARPIVRWARQFGSRRLSLSVADIPGPPNPLWLAGARLRRAAPIAPLTPLVPVCVAALSYAGELVVSVNADAAITDLDRVADGIRHSFATMQEATRTGELLPPALPAPLVGRGRLVIDCAIDIERPADVVFAYCTDASNEPQWNPQLRSVTTLTDGPIGIGTRYRLRFRGWAVADSVVEYVGFDPPRSWTARGRSARLEVCFEGQIVPTAAGSRLRFRGRRGAGRPGFRRYAVKGASPARRGDRAGGIRKGPRSEPRVLPCVAPWRRLGNGDDLRGSVAGARRVDDRKDEDRVRGVDRHTGLGVGAGEGGRNVTIEVGRVSVLGRDSVAISAPHDPPVLTGSTVRVGEGRRLVAGRPEDVAAAHADDPHSWTRRSDDGARPEVADHARRVPQAQEGIVLGGRSVCGELGVHGRDRSEEHHDLVDHMSEQVQ